MGLPGGGAFEKIVELSTEGVLVVERTAKLLYVNPAAQRLISIGNSDQLDHTSFLNYLGDPSSISWFKVRMEEGIPARGRIRLKLPCGGSCEREVRVCPVADYGAAYALFFQHDSERESSRPPGADSALEFNEIYDTVHLGILEVNEKGQILNANPRYCEIVGRDITDLIGRTIYEITHPDDIANQMILHEQVIEGLIESYTMAKRYITPDQKEVWAEITSSLIHNDRGSVRLLGVVHDVNEQRRLARALEESEQRLQIALEASRVGTWSTNLITGEQEWSAATREHLGASPTDTVSTEMFERYVDPTHLDHVMKASGMAIVTGQPFEFEFRTVGWDGRERWVSSRGRVLRDDAGQPERFIGVTMDITALKQAEVAMREVLERKVKERTDELTQANRYLESFCYSISHDLRAPLRAIVASSQILLRDFGEGIDEFGREYLTRQAAAANRMAILIDDLLHLTRIGRISIEFKPVDISELVRSIANELNLTPQQIHIAPEMRLTGDIRLLRVCFLCLLSNAVKFCKLGSEPQIAVLQNAEGVVEIRDDGIGFDQKYVDRIFLPFERLVKDGDYSGTGIGLANVKIVAERHRGKAWAEGRPSEGSSFYLWLPN